ncbi:MAG: hypothetical protein AAB482_04780 [Patescibacteria group bacterium]
MVRVIMGAIVGLILSITVHSFISNTDFYINHNYSDVVDNYFRLILAVIVGLLGGYIGSKINQHYLREKQAGHSMNRNVDLAGKIIIIFGVFILFTLAISLNQNASVSEINYIFLEIVSVTTPLIASFFSVRALIQIQKTKDMGTLTAVVVLGISVFFYIWLLNTIFTPLSIYESQPAVNVN